jgi:hypothetical protein
MRAYFSILALSLLIGLNGEAWGQSAGSSQFAGVVTLVDTKRGLLVMQEQAQAIKLAPFSNELQIGERVRVEGMAAPYFTACPDYPDHPSGSSVLPAFETPPDWGDFFLARLRGFLHVPTNGFYTFWVSADDEAELWLGTIQVGGLNRAEQIALYSAQHYTEPLTAEQIASPSDCTQITRCLCSKKRWESR